MIGRNGFSCPRLARGGVAALAMATLPLLWLGLSLTNGSAVPAQEARLREVVLRSRWLPHALSAWVCLPLGYEKPLNFRRRYPVVYLLHGSPGAPRDWIEQGEIGEIEDTLVARGKIRPMILVAADGRGPDGDSQCTGWLDSADGALPMERVFMRELVPEIDRRFRSIAVPSGRALLGVSAGGYAAFNIGMRHPDAFGALAAHSGYFVAEDDDEVVLPMLGTDQARVRANSPSDRPAADLSHWGGRLYLDCGVDDDLAVESEHFHRRLQHAGIDHHYAVVPGDHSWDTWRRRLPISLPFIQQALQRLARGSAARPSRAFATAGVPTISLH